MTVWSKTLFLRRTPGMPRMLSRMPVINPGEPLGPVIRDKSGRWTMWYTALASYDNPGTGPDGEKAGLQGEPDKSGFRHQTNPELVKDTIANAACDSKKVVS